MASLEQQDIRWLQRFSNFRKALNRLRQAVEITEEKQIFGEVVSELLVDGLIHRFEYTHMQAWRTMRDYVEYQGYGSHDGIRKAIRKALEINIIDDVRWMDTIDDRNQTSHYYDNETAARLFDNITKIYFPLFCRFEEKMIEKIQMFE